MVSTFTTNKNIEKPGNGDYVDTWNVPVNDDFNVVDAAFGGTIYYNATAGSQTLTSGVSDTYSYIPLFVKITGAIGAAVTYTIPSGVGGTWVVYNTTTDSAGGPWPVYFASAGGGTVVPIARNTLSTIICDGTNVYTTAIAGGTYARTNFVATSGQTTFTVSYTPSKLSVYVNGVLLDTTDYTATNGTSVVLGVGCNAGDNVAIMTY